MQKFIQAILMAKWNSEEEGSQAGSAPLIPLNTTQSGALKVALTDASNGSFNPTINSDGEMLVTLSQLGDVADIGALIDSLSDSGLFGQTTRSIGVQFNGTTYDRVRNNIEETVLASAARTASVNSADFTNYNNKGGHFIVDVSATAATPSIVMTIQGKDPVSGNYYDILVCTAITATGTNIFKVYPGIPGAANVRANDVLPRTWRVSIAAADADSITYSVGFNSVG